MTATKALEVHTHSFVSGPRAGGHYERNQWHTGTFSHSHAGGDVGHEHPHTGPSCYVIDKDDWYRSTGLRGGGRKKFTVKPTGEQFPIVDLQEWQRTFAVILGQPTPPEWGNGPGLALPLRMVRAFKMRCVVKDGRHG